MTEKPIIDRIADALLRLPEKLQKIIQWSCIAAFSIVVVIGFFQIFSGGLEPRIYGGSVFISTARDLLRGLLRAL
jgi:hypothetical protein